MKGTAKRLRYIPVLAAVLTASAAPVHAVIIDKVVAVVNDEVITQSEMARMLMPLYAEYSKEFKGEHLKKKLVQAEDEILEKLIEEKLISSEARRQNIEAPEEEIAARLDEISSKFSSEDAFEEALRRDNMTLQELKDKIRDDVIKTRLVQQKLGPAISITPAEVAKYYNEHRNEFETREAVRVRGILVQKGAKERTEEESRFLIEKILDMLKHGRAFEELAKEYSEGPNAPEGGDMGFVERGDLLPEIDGVIFDIEPGAVSDIVETRVGYHLLTVTERRAGRVRGFEEVRNEIREDLHRQKLNASLDKWIEELKKNAYISLK